jgi:hypothetical protein
MTNWIKQFTQSPDGLLWAALAPLPTTEAENLTWQRVDMLLAGATPGAVSAFQGLRKWLTQQKSCPDLRMTQLGNNAVAPLGLITAGTGGLYGATTTARLFGVYIKKTAVAGSALPSYLTLTDDGTDSALSGLAGSQKLAIPLGAVSSGAPGTIYEGLFIDPNGLPLAAGLRFALVTAVGGVTISAAADGGDGFCITSP